MAARAAPEAALEKSFKDRGLSFPKKRRGWEDVAHQLLTKPTPADYKTVAKTPQVTRTPAPPTCVAVDSCITVCPCLAHVGLFPQEKALAKITKRDAK